MVLDGEFRSLCLQVRGGSETQATPVHNSLLDIFPYLKFGGVVFWDDFQNNILKIMGKNRDLALKRAQVSVPVSASG